MKSDPDDQFANHDATGIEQRLRQLRPEPVGFDAASTLTAAAQPSTGPLSSDAASLVATSPAAGPSPSSRWTIAVSTLSGAVAGAALTLLVLAARGNFQTPLPAAHPNVATTPAPPTSMDQLVADDQHEANDPGRGSTAATPPSPESTTNFVWPVVDVVSSPRGHRLPPLNSPLTAGNFRQQMASVGVSLGPSTIQRREPRDAPGDRSPGSGTFEAPTSPRLDSQQLLRELGALPPL